MQLNEPSPRMKKRLTKLLEKMYPNIEILDFSFTYRFLGDDVEKKEERNDTE